MKYFFLFLLASISLSAQTIKTYPTVAAMDAKTPSRDENMVLNADYTTGQLPILIRKADATYKRIGITNVGGNDTLYIIP